jgi:hypothetical protein
MVVVEINRLFGVPMKGQTDNRSASDASQTAKTSRRADDPPPA